MHQIRRQSKAIDSQKMLNKSEMSRKVGCSLPAKANGGKMSKTAWMTVVALHLRACIVSTLALAPFRTAVPLVFMLSLEYLQGR